VQSSANAKFAREGVIRTGKKGWEKKSCLQSDTGRIGQSAKLQHLPWIAAMILPKFSTFPPNPGGNGQH
jgi:hypothetical protein